MEGPWEWRCWRLGGPSYPGICCASMHWWALWDASDEPADRTEAVGPIVQPGAEQGAELCGAENSSGTRPTWYYGSWSWPPGQWQVARWRDSVLRHHEQYALYTEMVRWADVLWGQLWDGKQVLIEDYQRGPPRLVSMLTHGTHLKNALAHVWPPHIPSGASLHLGGKGLSTKGTDLVVRLWYLGAGSCWGAFTSLRGNRRLCVNFFPHLKEGGGAFDSYVNLAHRQLCELDYHKQVWLKSPSSTAPVHVVADCSFSHYCRLLYSHFPVCHQEGVMQFSRSVYSEAPRTPKLTPGNHDPVWLWQEGRSVKPATVSVTWAPCLLISQLIRWSRLVWVVYIYYLYIFFIWGKIPFPLCAFSFSYGWGIICYVIGLCTLHVCGAVSRTLWHLFTCSVFKLCEKCLPVGMC